MSKVSGNITSCDDPKKTTVSVLQNLDRSQSETYIYDFVIYVTQNSDIDTGLLEVVDGEKFAKLAQKFANHTIQESIFPGCEDNFKKKSFCDDLSTKNRSRSLEPEA